MSSLNILLSKKSSEVCVSVLKVCVTQVSHKSYLHVYVVCT